MPTHSSHIDDATARRIAEVAKLEDRKASQITAAALRWYLRLPASARDAFRRIEAGGAAEAEKAAWAMGRAVLDEEFRALSARAAHGLETKLPATASEADIMEEAVRLTRRG